MPSLTTISPDKAGIATTAVDRLLAAIDRKPAGPAEVTCGFRLVVRGSTAS